MTAMRKTGARPEEVLAELDQAAAADVDWRGGRVLTGLYVPDDTAYRLSVEAYTRFLSPNALYVNFYPSLGRLEREIVRSVADLLRGDADVVGNVTSGGTESILLAVKAARDHARARRDVGPEPEIVLPVTAHPAFHKAAQYLGLRPVVIPVDAQGYRADVRALRAALSPRTVLAVGSAPNFSHGTIDPIADMAAVAQAAGVLFHVDACVGGLYLSMLRRLGEPVREFDFAVPGVTSISTDLHKYGYAPKNASVVLYRDRALRRHALFVCTGTTEYAVINPTAQSSRTGGPIAAAWALLRHLGEEGFARIVRATHAATRRMLDAIRTIDGIAVLGDPEMCMFTLGSAEINVFELDDEMRERGWHMIPQFACGGSPANLHVSVSWANVPHVEAFVADLREAVATLRRRGSDVDRDAMARAVARLAGRPAAEVLVELAPLAGLEGTELPRRMARLNTLLDLLPVDQRDEALALYANLVG